MEQLAQQLHLLGTAAFVGMSAVVGFRLLLLCRRSGQAPELLLGLGILGTAVFGYGPLIASLLMRATHPETGPTGFEVAMTGLGKTLHDVGVTMILLFVMWVFRPRDRWARVLFAAAMLLLWTGYAGVVANGGLVDVDRRGFFWWLEYVVVWTYPAWTAIESLRYHALMRKRVRIGLADPLVANRFLLWGAAAVLTILAVWTSSAPLFMAGSPERMATWTPPLSILTAVFGMATVLCYGFTFFPPGWYRRRFAVSDAAEAPAA